MKHDDIEGAREGARVSRVGDMIVRLIGLLFLAACAAPVVTASVPLPLPTVSAAPPPKPRRVAHARPACAGPTLMRPSSVAALGHFTQAKERFDASDYRSALTLLETAWAGSYDGAVLYDIAVVLERLGQKNAIRVYQNYLHYDPRPAGHDDEARCRMKSLSGLDE